jgi:CBS-domain-containing membrane protein
VNLDEIRTSLRIDELREKVKGDAQPLPPMATRNAIGLAALGGILAIALVAGLTQGFKDHPLILGSFGATCVLVFGFPDAPFSQPRNVVGGHFFSSLVGLLFLEIFNYHWWTAALAVGGAIALMMATRTVHPPAGANPVIVYLGVLPQWKFLWFPTLFGAILVVLVALLFNNMTRDARYPKYW